MSISQALVSELKHESTNTRKLLEAVPEDRFDWKPHEKSMTLRQLASHIAENPSWVGAMMTDEMDFAEVGKDYSPFAAQSSAELLEAFDDNVKGAEELLGGRGDEFMRKTWTMRNGDTVMMQLPRDAAIRSTAINHSVHHRGQLTVYLRILDVPVPPTYGPTADDPSF